MLRLKIRIFLLLKFFCAYLLKTKQNSIVRILTHIQL
ncbi:hypothetical protein SAMN05421731_103191 [Acinetobacter puyangensis]|uniref:Uncharacterized protein n=1 Tax=Acinetobacter puyangensis TaxID=1096779 RepID=A0A240E874_9GAMM|nr:hypothetical protein SAMN05421731_103191 [Acinetobacter puyangensis]